MPHPRNEYTRALSVSGGGSSHFRIRGGGLEVAAETENILLSGRSNRKLELLLRLMEQFGDGLPVVVVTDSQRSQLAQLLSGRQGANFSLVRWSGESAYYNFLRHKDEQEMLQFFSQIAAEHGLFGQRQVEAETLLLCILRLSLFSTNIFQVLAEGRMTLACLSDELDRQRQRRRLGEAEYASLLSNVHSSISAVQHVSLAFREPFSILANMRGIPFSIQDVLAQRRKVCFCLDGAAVLRNPCWYLGIMLQYDLNCCLPKAREPFLLVLDLSSKEKLALFSSLIGTSCAQVILNVENTGYLEESGTVSSFSQLYIFSHMDLQSAKYWSDYFATRRVPEYTHITSYNRTSQHPLLPFSLASLMGSVSKGDASSYSLVDRPIFEVNEIRELADNECIHYNHKERRPGKLTLR